MRLALILTLSLSILFLLGCQGGINQEKANSIIKDFVTEVKDGALKNPADQEKLLTEICKKNGTTIDAWNKYVSSNPDARDELQKAIQEAMMPSGGATAMPAPSPSAIPESETASETEDVSASGIESEGSAETESTGDNSDIANMTKEQINAEIQNFMKDALTSLPSDKMLEVSQKMIELGEKMESAENEAEALKGYGEMIEVLKAAGVDTTRLDELFKQAVRQEMGNQ